MSILAGLGASIAGGLFGSITKAITDVTGQIADTKVKLAQEANRERRIELERELGRLEVQRGVLVAQAAAGDTTASTVQALFAIVALIWFIYEVLMVGVLGQWTEWKSADLPETAEWALVSVIGFYFVASTLNRMKR